MQLLWLAFIMTESSCISGPLCAVRMNPPQIIPYEYQGWLMIIFLLFGIIAILYSLYLMTGDKQWKKQTQKSGK